MKIYTILYAEDVPHYGSNEIEAGDDEAAIAHAKAIDFEALSGLTVDSSHEDAVCKRIVHIEREDGEEIARDIPLDEFRLRRGGDATQILCDHAEALLKSVQNLIEKADDLQAAIEGVTDQFEDEVSALSAAASAAEKIANAARGQR